MGAGRSRSKPRRSRSPRLSARWRSGSGFTVRVREGRIIGVFASIESSIDPLDELRERFARSRFDPTRPLAFLFEVMHQSQRGEQQRLRVYGAPARTYLCKAIFDRGDEPLQLTVRRRGDYPVGLPRYSQLHRATLHQRAGYHRAFGLARRSVWDHEGLRRIAAADRFVREEKG